MNTTKMNTNFENNLKTIEPITLHKLLNQNKVVLVDVREPEEHKEERIAGSIRVSLSDFDPRRIPRVKGKQLYLYCRSGNRSAKAAQKLFEAGYQEVTHLQGGIKSWKAAGYQTQTNRIFPISLMKQMQIVAGSLVLAGVLLGTFVTLG